jgi:hypothetical protein
MKNCSEMARAVGEMQGGTGAMATMWLCLEQPGPWGVDALRHSDFAEHLPSAEGLRTVLIRKPGRTRWAERRTAYVAYTVPGRSWLRRVTFTDPREVLEWDLSPSSTVGDLSTYPLLLVCTNGKRDMCCALKGRPLAEDLARRHRGAVWESSHLGGHRFAPAVLALPTGYSYGWMDTVACDRVMTEAIAGRMVVDRCRGRSTWSGPAQLAELELRRRLGEVRDDALLVLGETVHRDGTWDVRLRHRGGGEWRVWVGRRTGVVARPTSCHREPVLPVELVVTAL